jgi:hypothetical protein
MYHDDFVSHPLPQSVTKVIVLETGDLPLDADRVMEWAEGCSTSLESEGKCYWLVLPGDARRAWPFTESGLRNQIRLWNKKERFT